jgi:hypothetical protein
MYDRIIYVAGPYRAPTEAQVQANIEKARDAAQELWRKGYAVICPHMNSAHMGYGNDQAFLEGDLTMIRRLNPEKDGIYLIDGWIFSAGAKEEWHLALHHGITVYRQGYREPPDLTLVRYPTMGDVLISPCVAGVA